MKVPVGPSTVAMLIGAIGAATAFIVGWAETGSAPAWLAGIAAGMTAIMAWLRSWQAVNGSNEQPHPDMVDEEPVVPDDYQG